MLAVPFPNRKDERTKSSLNKPSPDFDFASFRTWLIQPQSNPDFECSIRSNFNPRRFGLPSTRVGVGVPTRRTLKGCGSDAATAATTGANHAHTMRVVRLRRRTLCVRRTKHAGPAAPAHSRKQSAGNSRCSAGLSGKIVASNSER